MRDRIRQIFQAPEQPDAETTTTRYSTTQVSLVILATCAVMGVALLRHLRATPVVPVRVVA